MTTAYMLLPIERFVIFLGKRILKIQKVSYNFKEQHFTSNYDTANPATSHIGHLRVLNDKIATEERKGTESDFNKVKEIKRRL